MFQKLTEKDNRGGAETLGGGAGTGRRGGWGPPGQTSLRGAASGVEMRTCREAGRLTGKAEAAGPLPLACGQAAQSRLPPGQFSEGEPELRGLGTRLLHSGLRQAGLGDSTEPL